MKQYANVTLFILIFLFYSMGAFAQGDTPIDKDFGDLPDSYSTTGNNAPAHILVDEYRQLYLGDSITAEQDGQPSADAEGDTADDGVMASYIVLPPNDPPFLHLDITRNWLEGIDWRESPSIDIAVWIDWDHDGSFTQNEFHIWDRHLQAMELSSGHYAVGDLAVRVRLFVDEDFPGGTLDWTDFEGTVTNGEVEDYIINGDVQVSSAPLTPTQPITTKTIIPDSLPEDYRLVGIDFGDLHTSYDTRYYAETMTRSENLTFHTVSDEGQLRLGDSITTEDEAQSNESASRDTDDGVFSSGSLHIHHFDPFYGSISPYFLYLYSQLYIETYGAVRYMYAEVSGEMPPNGATLGVWIDWNHDHSFSEEEFSAFNALEGANFIFPVAPDDYENGALGMRFRLFDNRYIPGGTIDWQDSHGCAINGEIEDYVLAQPTGMVRRKNEVNHLTTTIDSALINGCTINGEIEDYLVDPTAISIRLRQHNADHTIQITLILTGMVLLLCVEVIRCHQEGRCLGGWRRWRLGCGRLDEVC